MKLVVPIFLLIISRFSWSQYFDYSYESTSIGDLRPELIEITSTGDIVAIGNDILMKTDSVGNLLWAKQVDLAEIRDLKLDEDDNIYFLENYKDSNNYVYSVFTKTSPDGYEYWKKKFGAGINEVHYQTIFIEDYYQLFLGGEMVTDTVWHNVVTKLNFMGNEDWSRRLFHFYGLSSNPIPKSSSILKIKKSPSGKFFALGHLENHVLVYKFNSAGGLHAFEEYWYKDSLKPVDIEIVWQDNVQLLMNVYEYTNHFSYRTMVKMQINESVVPVNAVEYDKSGIDLIAKDLEVSSYRAYILANMPSGYNKSIVERTYLDGSHDLSKEFYEQDSSQYNYDMELENDLDMLTTYQFGTDSTFILSKINPSFQSNCSGDYGTLLNNDTITVNHSIATSLALSACYPIIQTLSYTYQDISDVTSTLECTLYNELEEESVDIKIYPNPSSEFIQIMSSEPIGQIRIVNLNGQELIRSTETYIDIKDLSSGIYICLIETENTRYLQKFEVRK